MAKRKQPGLSPTKGQRVVAETRRYQMLELTKAGRTEVEIAEELGVAKSLVNRDVKRVLGELARSATRTAEAVRALQMERYLALLARWWERAMQGDAEAALMVLKIMHQIDVINGIIPDRPLIDMSVTQTVQVGEGMGLMELARYIANGNGDNGVGGTGPEDIGQPHALSNGRAGGETVPETD
jgi:DNA-binding CsgD family transcriptional regulator